MKYLKARGDWYHFERVVPPDVRDAIGLKSWREALNTDSRVEAEARCRRRTVETDEIIEQAKNGTFRVLDEDEIEDLAIDWGIDFQINNRENIAREAFPDVWGKPEPIGDEAIRPIIRSKADLASYVTAWLELGEVKNVRSGTPDFDALLDACLDQYLLSNPEISNEWKDILAELQVLPDQAPRSAFGTLERQRKSDPRRKLSSVFRKFLANHSDLGDSARSDFGTAVRRFIEFVGDIDVDQITRTHAEQFRDGLFRLPVRPPNKVRQLSMPEQLDWAELNKTKTLQRQAISKNILGVKRTLDFAFWETDLIDDRNWRNPFEGFQKKSKGAKKNRVRGFTDEQVKIAFSKEAFVPKTAERFWIPIILFYTGARLDEIAQLHLTDVKSAPVPHFLVENLENEDPALAKILKNETSHRTIPMHGDLVELGLFEYADSVRRNGHIHLFPALNHARGRQRGGYVSRKFMEGFRGFGKLHPDTGLDTHLLRTHSLRHTFRRLGYSAPDQDFIKIVMGHYVDGESIQTYGWEAYTMPELLLEKATRHVSLPELDRTHLKSLADGFLSTVREKF